MDLISILVEKLFILGGTSKFIGVTLDSVFKLLLDVINAFHNKIIDDFYCFKLNILKLNIFHVHKMYQPYIIYI